MIKLSPLKPDSEDMLHLDALRIVGALMIVVFHFNRFINLDGRWQLADDTIKSFSLIVDLFFLISGYVMAAIYTGRLTSPAKYGDFLKKRVARLGPLHWLTMLAFIAIAAAGSAGLINERDPSRYDASCIIPNVLFIHAWHTCQGPDLELRQLGDQRRDGALYRPAAAVLDHRQAAPDRHRRPGGRLRWPCWPGSRATA
jgi:peptidoglycan/LPS O-acetylase OafA/YrhL